MHVFRAVLNNPLHITTFRADQSSGYLELFIVWNLDVEPACVFDGLVVHVRAEILVLGLIMGLLLWHHKWLRRKLSYSIKHVLRLKHRGRRLFRLFLLE